MSAYFVAIRKSLHDPAGLETYRTLANKARDGHALEPLAAYGRVRSIEGDAVDGAVVLKFPTFEEAEAWYFSESYQEALPHRQAAGEYQTFIVEGVD